MSFAKVICVNRQISGYFETYHLPNDYDEITNLTLCTKQDFDCVEYYIGENKISTYTKDLLQQIYLIHVPSSTYDRLKQIRKDNGFYPLPSPFDETKTKSFSFLISEHDKLKIVVKYKDTPQNENTLFVTFWNHPEQTKGRMLKEYNKPYFVGFESFTKSLKTKGLTAISFNVNFKNDLSYFYLSAKGEEYQPLQEIRVNDLTIKRNNVYGLDFLSYYRDDYVYMLHCTNKGDAKVTIIFCEKIPEDVVVNIHFPKLTKC